MRFRTARRARYLRHFSFDLRIDVLSSSSSTVDRQDATFRITP